jgi:endonuclease YncB( thermonuclease family)
MFEILFLLGASAPLPLRHLIEVSPPVPVDIIRVIDGDTVVGSINGVVTRIRLCGIDAPERKQPLAAEATSKLRSILYNKQVLVDIVGLDYFRRSVGSLYVNSESVQSAMAATGLAYSFKSRIPCPDWAEIVEADNLARRSGLGMRSIPGFTPPWEFRRYRKVPIVPPLRP